MARFANLEDRNAIEQEMPYADRPVPVTLYQALSRTRDRFGSRKALSFQIESGPKSRAVTYSWDAFHGRVTQAANLFRSLGVAETDVVAYLLPNALETAEVLLGGAIAGIVNPINPLLEPEQIAAILRETGAKVLVTLKSFPKADIAQKAAVAVKSAPEVKTVLEVDLNRYLAPPRSWIVPFVRPAVTVEHGAVVKDYDAARARMPRDRLNFADSPVDRVAAYFHTGGTTGMPKVAQHKYSGMLYNGWLGAEILFSENDVILCPLPLFHVLAAYPVMMSAVLSGAHLVLPTPAGYRGEGVFDNLWQLIERWKVSFIVAVPTAISALLQRPVRADVSSLRNVLSGSAPLPMELFKRFEAATGVQISEGYGLTEATCLVSFNPVGGHKKVGSVGVPLPYTDVQILLEEEGTFRRCGVDEVGEICVANPGVVTGATYTEAEKNRSLFALGTHVRTGDLGRIDKDGFLWITGRAKDLIIRGGHNIDPAVIEDALLAHEQVAFAGAIGQPDARSGELPCAYVELVAGATVTAEELTAFARERIVERAAAPKYIEVLAELPKTAVGKVFKPDLRKRAITRVLDAALQEAGLPARVSGVVDDKKRGMVVQITCTGTPDEAALGRAMGEFSVPWDLA